MIPLGENLTTLTDPECLHRLDMNTIFTFPPSSLTTFHIYTIETPGRRGLKFNPCGRGYWVIYLYVFVGSTRGQPPQLPGVVEIRAENWLLAVPHDLGSRKLHDCVHSPSAGPALSRQFRALRLRTRRSSARNSHLTEHAKKDSIQ